jgi:hypothetical protein
VLAKQFYVLGTPDEDSWPGVTTAPDWSEGYEYEENHHDGLPVNERFGDMSDEARRFISRMLVLNPHGRASLTQLLADPWLNDAQTRVSAAHACLATPPLGSLDCVVALTARQAPVTTFRHSAVARFRLYAWLESTAQRIGTTDRAQALTVHLFERARVEPIEDLGGALVSCAAALSIASALLDPKPTSAQELVRDKSAGARVRERTRQVLTATGFDLYVATSYDVLLTLLQNHSDVTQGIACTLLQLSYYTSASRNTPEAVALACLRAACSISREVFGYAARVEGLAAEVGRVDVALGPELAGALQGYDDSRYDVLERARRGSQDTIKVLKDERSPFKGHYAWLMPLA